MPRLRQTQENIAKLAPGVKTKPLILDLASLKQVRQAAQEVESWDIAIDVLINNAAVMSIPQRELSEDGYELQFASNHLGPFLFTNTILPSLKRATAPRVVSVSSWGHHQSPVNFDDINWEKSYDKFATYGQSKTANILFAIGLSSKCGVCAVSLHPGLIRTDLWRHLTREDQLAVGACRAIYAWRLAQRRLIGFHSAPGLINEDGSNGDRFPYKNLQEGAAT